MPREKIAYLEQGGECATCTFCTFLHILHFLKFAHFCTFLHILCNLVEPVVGKFFEVAHFCTFCAYGATWWKKTLETIFFVFEKKILFCINLRFVFCSFMSTSIMCICAYLLESGLICHFPCIFLFFPPLNFSKSFFDVKLPLKKWKMKKNFGVEN